MTYRIVPVLGRYAVYINGKFYCFADNMKIALTELNKYKKCIAR